MWVTLALDSNGILEITVRDRSGNKIAYATSSKVSDGEI